MPETWAAVVKVKTPVWDRPDGQKIGDIPAGTRVTGGEPEDGWARLNFAAGKQAYSYCREGLLPGYAEVAAPPPPPPSKFYPEIYLTIEGETRAYVLKQ